MANEITANGSVTYSKGAIGPVSLGKTGKQINVSGSNFVEGTQVVTISSPQAINLGGVGTPGWFFIQNNDPVNYVTVYDSVSGNAFLKIPAGEFAEGRFAATAPAVLANTGSVVIEYLIVEN